MSRGLPGVLGNRTPERGIPAPPLGRLSAPGNSPATVALWAVADQQRRRAAMSENSLPHGATPQNDFAAQYRRVLEAAGCGTGVELAAFLDIRQSAISDARRRGFVPPGWLVALVEKNESIRSGFVAAQRQNILFHRTPNQADRMWSASRKSGRQKNVPRRLSSTNWCAEPCNSRIWRRFSKEPPAVGCLWMRRTASRGQRRHEEFFLPSALVAPAFGNR